MKRPVVFIHFFILIIFLLFPPGVFPVAAQSSLEDELQSMKIQFEQMRSRMDDLEGRVARQQKELAARQETEQVYVQRIEELEARLARSAPDAGSAARNPLGKWNPEIGVVADMVYSTGGAKSTVNDTNRLSLRELELVLGSSVAPYSRLDATIAFSDSEEPSLEEAYLTRFGLPLDTTARVGKFKPGVGKAIPAHRDSLETVDEPLVIQRYFGAEGFNKTGVDFSKTLHLSWPVTHQINLGILEGGNGEEGTAFGGSKRRPTLYSHLKNYLDLSDAAGLELGFAHMAGSQDDDKSFSVQVLAADATFTHRLNADKNWKLQGEVFNLNRRETEGFDGNLWGSYGLLDLRFNPRWSSGFRYDYVEPVDNDRSVNPNRAQTAYTGYLTFYQSELARWRVQAAHIDHETGEDDNQFLLQGTFAIGEHKHKLQ